MFWLVVLALFEEGLQQKVQHSITNK